MRIDDERELDELRARAYGPHADIQLDPAALRRLHELEGRYAAERDDAPGPEMASAASTPVAASPTEQTTPSAGAPLASDAEQSPSPAARPRNRRRTIALAAAAVVVVAAVTAAGFGLNRLRSDPLHTGAKVVARLSPDPGYSIPQVLRPTTTPESPNGQVDSIEAFQVFHDLRIVAGTGNRFGSVDDEICLLIYPSQADANPNAAAINGQIWSGCAAGAFPAAVQFDVTSDLPLSLRSAFPGGLALRFVYDERHRRVVVYAASQSSGRR